MHLPDSVPICQIVRGIQAVFSDPGLCQRMHSAAHTGVSVDVTSHWCLCGCYLTLVFLWIPHTGVSVDVTSLVLMSSSHWCPCGVALVPMWCRTGAHVVSHGCPCGVTRVPMWCHTCAHVVSHVCPCGVTLVPMRCRTGAHVVSSSHWCPCGVTGAHVNVSSVPRHIAVPSCAMDAEGSCGHGSA